MKENTIKKKWRKRSKMGKHVLVNDSKKYCGKYVATASFWDKAVMISGSNLNVVLKQAKKKGIIDPTVFYIPSSGVKTY